MRDRNTFAKRQRETGKRQKAADKRARRQKRQESAGDATPSLLALPTASSQRTAKNSMTRHLYHGCIMHTA